MQSRRRFLGSLLGGGIALRVSGNKVSGATTRHKESGREVPKGFAWQTTVFCQLGDPGLLAAIGMAAQRIGCEIWLGEPHSPDILAVPYFVSVLDRRTLDRDGWDDYLAFRREVEDSTPCIVLDDLGWPLDDYMETFERHNETHVHRILSIINQAYREAQKWTPEDIVDDI